MHADAARLVPFPPLAGVGAIGPARAVGPTTITTITTRTISPVRPVVFA